MFTPSDIREKVFKTGIGYDKKDVEQFLNDLSSEYEALQSENTELKKKSKDQTETIAYYKSIEKTLQKALILAEKTAQDTRATALKEADAIELEAKAKAGMILADAKKQNEVLEHKTINLVQQYDLFKIHFENLLHAQIELINSKSFSINTEDFQYKEPSVSDKDVNSERDTLNEDSIEEFFEVAAVSIEDPDDINQIHFDFLDHHSAPKTYQTEDGFEIFTMKDE